MDVRCEKCQTEYELDESRLKPGGVTVKCTNCGHMFKIRKRTPTNVGLSAVTGSAAEAPPRPRQDSGSSRALAPDTSRDQTRREPMPQRQTPVSGLQPQARADSVLGAITDGGSGPTPVERQWLVRLENGEQKTCRELATLQQWIVAGVATRESLISRSGKTWKRLGDITELSQYFTIADEARNQRAAKPTPTPKPQAATMLGIGGRPGPTGPTAAGGTILPDDPDERKTTGSFRSHRTTPPPPPPQRAPGSGPSTLPKPPDASPVALQQTELSQPGRATGTWASSEIKSSASMAEMPQGPRSGKLAMGDSHEPAFSGRVRLSPGDESSFQTGKVSRIGMTSSTDDDDDDAMMQPQRGSRAGTWIALLALVVIAAGAGAVYMLVFNKKTEQAAVKQDAGQVAVVADASAPIVSAIIDAAPPDPLDSARAELLAGIEPRMKGVFDALALKDDGPSLAMRARLACGMAQSMLERAGLVSDKAEADKLRKDSKQLVIDAAPLAQRALKAAADDPSANLAMADVLRLQAKPIKDVQRYLEAAKAKGAADKELARSIALSNALTLARDAKLDDAQRALVALDGNGDTRVQQELALVAYAQGKPADAKPFVDQILAASPDHDVARALQKRLETAVAKTDPMPNEGSGSVHHDPTPSPNSGGGDYDTLVAKADKLASSSCTNAMPLYSKALEQKPTGVEALTGMGYCYLDSKQFASAFSKFRSALAVSSRFEPALAGVAETYQQQGNKDQAIEAWNRYLEANPGSPKATKQLQILGAGASNGSATPPPTGAGSSEPPPTPVLAPTPTPTPTPTPAPAPSDGSAS
ncbi:MAG: zinc-ribbon domain-containing protein [Kofleriaceae bacterium]